MIVSTDELNGATKIVFPQLSRDVVTANSALELVVQLQPRSLLQLPISHAELGVLARSCVSQYSSADVSGDIFAVELQ